MSRSEFKALALQFADDVAHLVEKKIMEQLDMRGKKAKKAKATVHRKPCRVPGCKEPSKGPRYDFFCDEHRKLSKAAKAAVKNGEPLPTAKKKAVKKKAKAAPKKAAKSAETAPAPAPAPTNGNGEKANVIVGTDGVTRIEHGGESLTPRQWSEKLGLNPEAVAHRIRRGMDVTVAITKGA